jgi:hypothetical protein
VASDDIDLEKEDVVVVRTVYGKHLNNPEKYQKTAEISKEVS